MSDNFEDKKEIEEENRNVFPFFQLPLEMRRMIIDNVDGPTFTSLLKTGKQMKRLLNNGKWFFYRKVLSLHQYSTHFEVSRNGPDDRVAFDIVNSHHWKLQGEKLVIEDALGEVGLIALLNFVAMHKIQAHMVEIDSDVQVTGQNMALLCKLLSATKWLSRPFVSKEILLHVGKIVNKMFVVQTDCDDSTLLAMTNVSSFFMQDANDITYEGLNRLIKQWLRGERNLRGFVFDREANVGSMNVLLEGLTINVIWTEDDHEHSLLGHLPLAMIQERMQTAGMERIYSLCSHRDVSDFRVLRVGQSQIIFTRENNEAEMLQRIEEQL